MSSLSIRHYLANLFEENERLAKPLTDEQLEDKVRDYFLLNYPAERLRSLSNLPSTCKSRIRIWRSEYNRGLWLPIPQKVFSFRYGPAGKPINRNGNLLSPFEIEQSRKKHASNTSVKPKSARSSSTGA